MTFETAGHVKSTALEVAGRRNDSSLTASEIVINRSQIEEACYTAEVAKSTAFNIVQTAKVLCL